MLRQLKKKYKKYATKLLVCIFLCAMLAYFPCETMKLVSALMKRSWPSKLFFSGPSRVKEVNSVLHKAVRETETNSYSEV